MIWQRPEPRLLAKVVSSAEKSLLVASPFVKQFGLSLIEESMSAGVESLELWTRMDSRDWISGASDPDAILDFLEKHAGVRQVSLFTSNSLHAKLVIADDKIAAVGSGNLTRGGWGNNIEIVKTVEGDEYAEIRDYIADTRPLLTSTSLADFSKFVERCLAFGPDKEALLELMREIAPAPPHGAGPLIPLAEFIRYCSMSGGKAATDVIRIHANIDDNNRQGHVKQGYYGAQRFFQEYPQYKNTVAQSSPDHPFEIEDSELLDDWRRFLNDFQDEASSGYDYDIGTLIRILPASMGGIVIGGGGGGFPLKIVFPIIARMLVESST